MKLRQLLTILAISATTLSAAAKDEFTALEQQQISISTPGLFARSNAFTVDFAGLRSSDYSFPLPVGKAKATDDYFVKITTKKGDAVKSMFSGTVRLSRNNKNYGNVIVVRHGNGLETMYANNAENLVKVGDEVKAGQTIAIVGTEGGETYCRFAIMVNGDRINPEMIFGLASHRLHKQVIMCKKNGNRVEMSQVRDEQAEKRALAKKQDFDADPFEKSNKFTLNLANFSPKEWSYPLPGAKVISPYGRRGGRSHTGVDIKTKPNDDILAAFDGVVTMSQSYYGYGNVIKIKHANGLETLYSHNSKNLVKVGDKVKAGQVIALTGRTGRATTEHLHFECKIKGQTFDPAKLFDHLNNALLTDKVTFTKSGSRISIKNERNYMAKGK